MRVLQIVDTLAPGGRERLVVDLANRHARRGLGSVVCETRHTGELARALDPLVGHLVLDRSHRLNVTSMATLANYVRDNRIDVLHSHGRAVAQFMAVVKTVFRLRVPHIFHDHLPGIDPSTRASPALHLAARFGVDGVISVSDDLRDWAVKRLGFPHQRVWSVLNGIDVERFVSAAPSDLAVEFPLLARVDPVVVAVGNVRPQKDYETLLRAMALLEEPAHLLVLGSDKVDLAYATRCQALARRLGIAARVVFAGVRLDVPEILASADVGVLASRAESGPLAIAEYAAAGLPIVATKTGPITAALAHEPFAAVVDVGDVNAIASSLDTMLSISPDERREFKTAARARARLLFSLDRMADEVVEVYEAVRTRQSA